MVPLFNNLPISLLSILLITSGLKIKRAPTLKEKTSETILVRFKRGSEVNEKRFIKTKKSSNVKKAGPTLKRKGVFLPLTFRVFKVEGIREKDRISFLTSSPKPISSVSKPSNISSSPISIYLVPIFTEKVHFFRILAKSFFALKSRDLTVPSFIRKCLAISE